MRDPTYQSQEKNIYNLTSAASSDRASVSSHSLPKKKRKHLGNPDPDAEVIALSPRTLTATNRFTCEVCHKGFRREQNLQLHRRGHNLPWKLKQREAARRRKVYVCPEAGCAHHDPARALGDLTGVKKHFSRKHGEKKWRCDRCGKRYAVRSDWTAHAKVCGTREYRCHCGTIFSRRDSFIKHRAFCDALAEENARAVTAAGSQLYQPELGLHFSPNSGSGNSALPLLVLDPSPPISSHGLVQELSLKREQQQPQQQLMLIMPYWLSQQQQQLEHAASTVAPALHMSATALLQKSAEMGATVSLPANHQHQIATNHNAKANATTSNGHGTGVCLSTRDFLGSNCDMLCNMAGFEPCTHDLL